MQVRAHVHRGWYSSTSLMSEHTPFAWVEVNIYDHGGDDSLTINGNAEVIEQLFRGAADAVAARIKEHADAR